jgi:hypothetical protein
MFRSITVAEWSHLAAPRGAEPFLSPAWESVLTGAFPYLSFEHYLYGENYEVRMTKLGKRITTMPFSDGGDVISKNKVPLSLKSFNEDLIREFGKDAFVRVNEFYCPVTDKEGFRAAISDFRIVLTDEQTMLQSFRKTLRHILETPPTGGSIERTKDEGSVGKVYRLYLQNMKLSAGIALPWSAFNAVVESPNTELWVFKMNGKIRGASVFLNSSDASHYYISAGDSVGKGNFSSHKLLWHTMKIYANEGKKELFLGGTAIDSPLYIFKSGWRGEEYSVYDVGGSVHESARTSPLRSLWKLIPAPLLPKASQLAGKYVF